MFLLKPPTERLMFDTPALAYASKYGIFSVIAVPTKVTRLRPKKRLLGPSQLHQC